LTGGRRYCGRDGRVCHTGPACRIARLVAGTGYRGEHATRHRFTRVDGAQIAVVTDQRGAGLAARNRVACLGTVAHVAVIAVSWARSRGGADQVPIAAQVVKQTGCRKHTVAHVAHKQSQGVQSGRDRLGGTADRRASGERSRATRNVAPSRVARG